MCRRLSVNSHTCSGYHLVNYIILFTAVSDMHCPYNIYAKTEKYCIY